MTISRDSFNAFLEVPEVAVPHAQTGPLAGLTLAVKDIFEVAGLVTGRGNPQWATTHEPARFSAPVVAALLGAGAEFAGKTQTEELAFSMLGQNAHFPNPVNPAAPDRVTGGSSSGSAAAVAGGLADIATGSDTGGSIRAPASFCGLIGLRTTQGAISLEGTMPLAPTFDTFGWFARDFETYGRVADVLLGSLPLGSGHNRVLRSAAVEDLIFPECVAEYRRMADVVATTLGPASEAPEAPFAIDELYWCTRRLQAREAWDCHGAWIEEPGRQMGDAVRDRFLFGKTVNEAQVAAGRALRADFTDWLGELLGDDGVLVMPTVPCPAPFGNSTPQLFSEFREQAIRMLCWSGLSGFPQITLPLGQVDGAPFGISLLGCKNSDRALVRLAGSIMTAAGKA